MDNYREVELLAQKTIADSGTETIDLNVTEPITELSVRVYVKNDSAVTRNLSPEFVFTKLEIVDGGRVYSSVSGHEATAMAWYDKGMWPAAWYSEMASHGSRVEWPFQFGRYVGDPDFAFSAGRLLNPQLKVTWAKNTLHLADNCKLEVNAKVMQGVAAPPRALLTKSVRTWTTSDSGIVEVDLPTDYAFRRLYFRAYKSTSYLGNIWTAVKLECGVGDLIVFDMLDDELFNLMERTWGKAMYDAIVAVSQNVMTVSRLGALHGGSLLPGEDDRLMMCSITQPGYARCYCRACGGATQTDAKGIFSPIGLCPEWTFCYPFGLADKPETWFQAPRYGSIKLKVTEGTASADGSVFIQQPVPIG